MTTTPSEFVSSEMPDSQMGATPAADPVGFPPYPPYAVEPAPPSVAETIIAGRDLRVHHKSTPKKAVRPPPKPARPRGPKATDIKMSKRAMRAHARCLRRHGAVLNDRLERISKPPKRSIICLWREHADTLPADTIARLRSMLDADEPFKPDQAYEYFVNLKKTKKKTTNATRVNQIKRDVLTMCADKRFVWARNATVAFARGIQQRLSRPGRYALADGMLRLSNIIMDEICGYMHMRAPSRRCTQPKARFMMEMSDKVAIWIDEILSESDDRMLMMDFDEDEDVVNADETGVAGFADDFLNMMGDGELFKGPQPAYLKFTGEMLEAFIILTDAMHKKGDEQLLNHGKFSQTYTEGADELKRTPDFDATEFNTTLATQLNKDLANTAKPDTPAKLSSSMKDMVNICSNYLAQHAEFNKDKGPAFKLLVKTMHGKGKEQLYQKGKARRTYGTAATELDKSRGLETDHDDPNLSQEIHSALSKTVQNVTTDNLKNDMKETLDVCSKYLSQRAIDEIERGPAFDILIKELEKDGADPFTPEYPPISTKFAAAYTLKSAPGLSSVTPDPTTAPKFAAALHRAVDPATPKALRKDMNEVIGRCSNYLSAFVRDRDKALQGLLKMMKANASKELAKRNHYSMNYGTGAAETEMAPSIVPFLPVKDIADEAKEKLTADMEKATPPELKIAMKSLVSDVAKHLSQPIAMRSGAAGDRYNLNFLAAVKKSLGSRSLFKYKSYGQTYCDAAEVLKYAGPLEAPDPKSENLQYEISAEMNRGVPSRLAPSVAEGLSGTMNDASNHLAKVGVEKGEALEYLVKLMKKQGDASLGQLQGYQQTYNDGARRIENAPSLRNDKVDKGVYESVRGKLTALTVKNPDKAHEKHITDVVEDSSKFLASPMPETESEKRRVLADLMARKGDEILGQEGLYKLTYTEAGEELMKAPVGVKTAHDGAKLKDTLGKVNGVIPEKKLQTLLKDPADEGSAYITDLIKGRGEAMKVIHDGMKKEGDKEFMNIGKFNKSHGEAADMLGSAPHFGGQHTNPILLEKASERIASLDKSGGTGLAMKHMDDTASIASDYIAGIATKECGLDPKALAAMQSGGGSGGSGVVSGGGGVVSGGGGVNGGGGVVSGGGGVNGGRGVSVDGGVGGGVGVDGGGHAETVVVTGAQSDEGAHRRGDENEEEKRRREEEERRRKEDEDRRRKEEKDRRRKEDEERRKREEEEERLRREEERLRREEERRKREEERRRREAAKRARAGASGSTESLDYDPEREQCLAILHKQLESKGGEILYKQPHTELSHSEASKWLGIKPRLKVDKTVKESADTARLHKKFERRLGALVSKCTPEDMEDAMQDCVIESSRVLSEYFVSKNYKALVKDALISEMQKRGNEILVEVDGAAETFFFAAQRLKKANTLEVTEPCNQVSYFVSKKLDDMIRCRSMARKLTATMKEHIKDAADYLSELVTKPDDRIEAYVSLLGEMEATGDTLLIEGDIPKSYKDSAAYLRQLTSTVDQINRPNSSLQSSTESKLKSIMANVPARGYTPSDLDSVISESTRLLVSYIILQGEKTEALKILIERLEEAGHNVLLRHGAIRKSYDDGADVLRGKNADQLSVITADPVVSRKIQIKLLNLMRERTPDKFQALMDDVIEDTTLYLAVHLLQPRVIQVCKCMKNVFVQCELWCDEILRRFTRPCCTCSRHVSAQALADLAPTDRIHICPGTSRGFAPGLELSLKQCPSRQSRAPKRGSPTQPCPAAKPTAGCGQSTTSYMLYSTSYQRRYLLSPTRLESDSPSDSVETPDIPSPSPQTRTVSDSQKRSLMLGMHGENMQLLREHDSETPEEDKEGSDSSMSCSFHTPASSSGTSQRKPLGPYSQSPTTMFAKLHTPLIDVSARPRAAHSPITLSPARSGRSTRTPIVSTDQMADWHAMMVSLMWNVQAWRDWIQENIDRALSYQHDPDISTVAADEVWTGFQRRVATEALQWRQYNIFSRQLTLRLALRYRDKQIVSPTRATNKTETYMECQQEMLEIIDMFNRWTYWLTAVVKETNSLPPVAESGIPLHKLRWSHLKNKVEEYSEDWLKYNKHLQVCWEHKYRSLISDWLPAWKQPGPVWVVSACGAVPSGAVAAGVYDSELVWVARTTHRCNVLPAALHPSKHCCIVYADGAVHHYTKYQVMCNAEAKWLAWRAGAVGAHAVRVAPGVHVGRVHYRGSHLVGAVHSPHYRCHVVIFGRPFAFNCYELLVLGGDEA